MLEICSWARSTLDTEVSDNLDHPAFWKNDPVERFGPVRIPTRDHRTTQVVHELAQNPDIDVVGVAVQDIPDPAIMMRSNPRTRSGLGLCLLQELDASIESSRRVVLHRSDEIVDDVTVRRAEEPVEKPG